MSKEERTVYCSHCKQEVTWHREPLNHRLHLMLTVVSIGLWAPMWLVFTLLRVKYCDLCRTALLE